MHTILLVSGEKIDEQLWPFSVNVDVRPYEVFFTQEDIMDMAEHYGISSTDLAALADKIENWSGGKGFFKDGKIGRISTQNPRGKFDFYKVGGRYSGYLYLKRPRKPSWLGKLFGHSEVIRVDKAIKKDIDLSHMRADTPGALLHQNTWIEAPFEEDVSGNWDRQFWQLFETIPEDWKITAVDMHS
jgi:hypothetical protein